MSMRGKVAAEVVEEFDVDQGSEDWHKLRLGLPTASCFADMMAKGEGKMRDKLLKDLAGEKLSGLPASKFVSEAMQRGKEWEPEIYAQYAFNRGLEDRIRRVGFVRRTINDPLGGTWCVGCSPDAVVGEAERGVEFKSMIPRLLIEVIEAGRPPPEHRWQCQGTMWVKGLKVLDLVCYSRGMREKVFTIKRDDVAIAELKREAELFTWAIRKLVDSVKRKGGA